MKIAEATLEEITVRAVVTRADGTVEDHGTICHWDRKDQKDPPGGVVRMFKNFLTNKEKRTW